MFDVLLALNSLSSFNFISYVFSGASSNVTPSLNSFHLMSPGFPDPSVTIPTRVTTLTSKSIILLLNATSSLILKVYLVL